LFKKGDIMKWHFPCAFAAALLLAFGMNAAQAQDKKQKDDKKPAAAANYFPLEVGNQWTYAINAGGKSVTAVARVAKLDVINGISMARFETSVNGTVASTEHLVQNADGIFRHRFNGQEVDPPLCLLKYPAKAGLKWKGEFKVGKEDAKYQVETGTENVEVPAGKFDAIRAAIETQSKGQDVATSYWFAQNVGFVKQTATLGGLDISIELEKFEPGKKAVAAKESGAGKAVEPFNGKDLTGWKLRGDAKKSKWEAGTSSVNDKGALVFKQGTGELVNTVAGGIDIYSEQEFGDCRVEIEVMVPKGSNSGIYLMGRYEVQVFDSFGKEKLTGGDMGAIYSIAVPKINASKKAGEWQKYVIDFQAPRFEGTKKIANANFKKVVLNDQVIHENAEVLKGATGGSLKGDEVPVGPLLLQGDHGTVAYRNLRITPTK